MGMTQMQIIQSLGDATNWLERELGRGVDPAELRHLTGRIGELYAAVVTNGQLASEVNQKGYDVVSLENERISVKTTTMTSGTGHVAFNGNTLDQVDRVMVLRINIEEMQIDTLFDGSVDEAKELITNGNIALSKLDRKKPRRNAAEAVAVLAEVVHGPYLVRELETGSIEVLRSGDKIEVVRPVLLEICRDLVLSPLNGNGNPMNTRQLGYLIVRTLSRKEPTEADER